MGGGGVTSNICGILPPGSEDGEMPSDKLSVSSAWRGPAEVTFHVHSLFLTDSSVARGQGSAAPL